MVQIPRLPSVDVQTGQVVPVQAPQVRPMQDFSAEQIGQLGEGMMRAGRGAVRYAAYQQRQKEIEDAENAENIAMQSDMAFRDHLDNELNQENGYLSKVGPEAIDGYKPLLESAAKKAQEIEDSLDSDLAKKMFRRQANQKLMAFKADASQHYYNKRQTFRVGLMQAEADAAKGDASRVLNTFDAAPSEVSDEYKAFMVDKDGNPRQITPYQFHLEKFQAYLRRAGGEAKLDSVQIESAVTKATSDMHVESLNALVEQDPERAQKYFDKFKDGIDQKLHPGISKDIQRAGLGKFARDYASNVDNLIKTEFPNRGSVFALEQSLKLVEADLNASPPRITEEQAQAIETTLIKNSQRQEAMEKASKVETMQEFEKWASSPEATSNPNLQFDDIDESWRKRIEERGLTEYYQQWWDEGRQYVSRPGMYKAMLSKNDAYWLGLKTEDDVHRVWRPLLNNDHFDKALMSWRKAHGRSTATENSALSDSHAIKYAYEDVLKAYGMTTDDVQQRLKDGGNESKDWLLTNDSFERQVRERWESNRAAMRRDLTDKEKRDIINQVKSESVTVLKPGSESQYIQVSELLISPSKLPNAESLYSRNAYVGVPKDLKNPSSPVVQVPYMKILRAMNPKDPDVLAAQAEGFFESGTGDNEESNPKQAEKAKAVLQEVSRIRDLDLLTYNAGNRMGLPPLHDARWYARQIVDAEARFDQNRKINRDDTRAKTTFPTGSRTSSNIDLNPELRRVSSGTELNKFQWILDRAHEGGGQITDQLQREVNEIFPHIGPSTLVPILRERNMLKSRERLLEYGSAFSNDPVALKLLNEAWQSGGWGEPDTDMSGKDLGKGLVGLGSRRLVADSFGPYDSMIKNMRLAATNVLNQTNALINISTAASLSGISPSELNEIFGEEGKSYDSIEADRLFKEMTRRNLIRQEEVNGKQFYVLDKSATFWDTADDYSADRYRAPVVTVTRK